MKYNLAALDTYAEVVKMPSSPDTGFARMAWSTALESMLLDLPDLV